MAWKIIFVCLFLQLCNWVTLARRSMIVSSWAIRSATLQEECASVPANIRSTVAICAVKVGLNSNHNQLKLTMIQSHTICYCCALEQQQQQRRRQIQLGCWTRAATLTPSAWRATGTRNAAKSCASARPVFTLQRTQAATSSALVTIMSLNLIVCVSYCTVCTVHHQYELEAHKKWFN